MNFESVTFDDVKIGDELPAQSIPITTSLVVGGAIASRDFTPVHHDSGWARAQGMPDIMMNILTTQGLVSRYVTDWAGIDAVIRALAVKLGTPNHPGDTMKLSGRVTEKDEAAGVVKIEVTGANSWGDHVNATLELALPRTH